MQQPCGALSLRSCLPNFAAVGGACTLLYLSRRGCSTCSSALPCASHSIDVFSVPPVLRQRLRIDPAEKHSCHRPLLGCGFRWGEALHPGPSGQTSIRQFFGPRDRPEPDVPAPDDSSCVFAVVNPTSVLHKVPVLLRTGADIIAMSETSAVCQVPAVYSKNLSADTTTRSIGGLPVPSHTREDCSHPTMRGLAAGVALASRLPSHCSRPGLPPDAAATCRLSECFVRLGALQVRVLTIYGVPLSHQDARQRTEDLLAMAAAQATQNALPCIIAGDFNVPPLSLPTGTALAARGYQEVFALHHHIHAEQLPPTCRGATRNDTALLHPAVVPLFVNAWVLSEEKIFDSHDPLCFRLRLCGQRPCRQVWRLPRPWAQLGPNRDAFAAAFRPHAAHLKLQAQNCASTADIDAALLSFSQAAEDAVQNALAQQNQDDPLRAPHTTLPKAFRGRCVDRATIKRELPCLLRPDRAGGYQPDVEVTSVLGRMKVRQVRRVRTLHQGLAKLHRLHAGQDGPLRRQLRTEWQAVLRAKGYPPSFSVWLLRVACFHTVPVDLPDLEWISLLSAIPPA